MSKTFSLSEAADAIGCSKATIHRAIKTNKISALRDGNTYVIEVSELLRIWPGETWKNGPMNTPKQQTVSADAVEIRMLRELLAAKDELIEELRADKNRLLSAPNLGQGRGLWTRLRQMLS